MTRSRVLQMVVPAAVEDPTRPSGGNVYDRRLREELASSGWVVSTRAVAGHWPRPDEDAGRALCAALDGLPRDELVLMDGLVASASAEVVLPAAARYRLVVLLHLPLGWQETDARAQERAVLRAAAAVVTTSEWSRRWVMTTYGLDAGRVLAARPGVDLADPAAGTDRGDRLVCVGAVTPAKGQDLLLAALVDLADLAWRCVCVGSVVDDGFAARIRKEAQQGGVGDRFVLAGSLRGPALAARYAGADLLVLPSRAETYGMVVTEALARALPVAVSDVGGAPEALGQGRDGHPPGMLLPPDDATAWADGLRRWLSEPRLRAELRSRAAVRRLGLTGWDETACRMASVLAEVAR